MTGKTHKRGGMLMSLVGFIILKENNMLLSDVSQFLQWLVIYPFCVWGSMANDLDKNWASCPSKDYPSRIVHIFLHIGAPVQKLLDKSYSERQKKESYIYRFANLFNAHHRSWQTHSDLTIIFLIWLNRYLNLDKFASLGAVNITIISLVIMGISLGLIEHILLDILTPEGMKLCLCKLVNMIFKLLKLPIRLPEVFKFIPKRHVFATGGIWEQKVYKCLDKLTYIILILAVVKYILFPLFPYEISLGG